MDKQLLIKWVTYIYMRPDIGMSEILPLRFVGSIPALSNMYSIQLYVITSFPVIYGRSKVVSRYPVSLINNTVSTIDSNKNIE
jgi:hypothetical protein